jgi:8-oxo-dGTP pyrophosphatase MutT (NUDIX family)
MNKTRTGISDIVSRIEPFDVREREDLLDVADWIADGSDLYRRAKPDVPRKHLVSYFVLVDHTRRSLLLMDHVKSGLWVPTGGHVEPDEDPYDTVRRELAEELGEKAQMVASVARSPLFVTVTTTRGPGTHVDVSLWYVVAGDEKMWLDVDPREFRGHRWQTFESVLDTKISELDPQMHRFVSKLMSRL